MPRKTKQLKFATPQNTRPATVYDNRRTTQHSRHASHRLQPTTILISMTPNEKVDNGQAHAMRVQPSRAM